MSSVFNNSHQLKKLLLVNENEYQLRELKFDTYINEEKINFNILCNNCPQLLKSVNNCC